ncbi:LEA/WHy family protein [Halobacterium rubrum]|uniref:LEA type 2 family protein n=1 Tax=Halobacterium TaxID=2239 RepID=UPI001F313B4E|nr:MULTISPECIES: LEA type 2 family protein [Halobacterium]MDH5020981.1 LEA type 2 family protein [Halobacterium rubrum]
MNVRGLLLGSKLRVAATVLLGLVVVAGGAFAAGFLGVPAVAGVDNEFGDVNESVTEIETVLAVNNPNPVGASLGGVRVNYSVAMNDVTVAEGEKRGVGVDSGNSTVNLTTDLQNDQIPAWWVTHVNGGESSQLAVDATVTSSTLGRSVSFQPANRAIDTDVLGQFNSSEDQDIDANAPLVSDPVLIIEERDASWGEATSQETPIDLTFRVHNPKAQPVAISSVGYDITMNDVDVGDGETEETVTIPGCETRAVSFPTTIRTQALDDWWVSHLENDQVTNLTIDFYAEIQPPGTDESVRVPLDGLTYEKTIETDIFGDDSESADGGDDTETTTATTTAATTTTSEDSDDSPTASETTTTSDTPTTTTSDGGNETTTTEDDDLLS